MNQQVDACRFFRQKVLQRTRFTWKFSVEKRGNILTRSNLPNTVQKNVKVTSDYKKAAKKQKELDKELEGKTENLDEAQLRKRI